MDSENAQLVLQIVEHLEVLGGILSDPTSQGSQEQGDTAVRAQSPRLIVHHDSMNKSEFLPSESKYISKILSVSVFHMFVILSVSVFHMFVPVFHISML